MRKIIKYILSIALLLSFAISDDPMWEVVAQDYEFGATLSAGSVTIDGVGQSSGKLAAFVGDEIRGVDSDGGSVNPFTGGHFYEVIVNDKNMLLGTLSDGDLRKAILNGITIRDSIRKFYN